MLTTQRVDPMHGAELGAVAKEAESRLGDLTAKREELSRHLTTMRRLSEQRDPEAEAEVAALQERQSMFGLGRADEERLHELTEPRERRGRIAETLEAALADVEKRLEAEQERLDAAKAQLEAHQRQAEEARQAEAAELEDIRRREKAGAPLSLGERDRLRLGR